MSSRQVSLREHVSTSGVFLDLAERDALRSLLPSLVIQPDPGADSLYTLTPASEVGCLQVGPLELHILPKIPVKQLFFLLAYSTDPVGWESTYVHSERSDTIADAVASAFLFRFRQATRSGLLAEYAYTDATETVLRGRLRFREQISRQMGRPSPLEISFDDLSVDVLPNRILKAALRCLARLPNRNDMTRRGLRRALGSLAEVTDIEFEARSLPHFVFTPLNQHYQRALELAQLILCSWGFDHGPGGTPSAGFLVDMNRVVERFVVVALREALGLNDITMPQAARGKRLFLDFAERIRLRPDVSWWSGPTCRFVGDVKYKPLGPDDVPNSDLYQLLSYAIACGTTSGTLIYAGVLQGAVSHVIRRTEKCIEVYWLDLTTEPAMLLVQVRALAASIYRRVSLEPGPSS